MLELKTGQFYGVTNQTLQLQALIITDTEYTIPVVDWHYHENAYFTFIIQGNVIEGNKKEVYHCTSGDLLFHNWQEAHYNIKPKGFTRGFQIELKQHWFDQYDISSDIMEGSSNIKHPFAKLEMYRIFATTKQDENPSEAAIDSLLISLLSAASGYTTKKVVDKPLWVNRLRQLLNDEPESHLFSLKELANVAGVHPVHISRSFPIYFNNTLSDYLRQLKIQRALALMSNPIHTLSSIAASCGFADQSHFIRIFKQYQQMSPLSYKKLISRC
ncbi:AraC-like DNA-binding protein [Pedobacter duraquae]|uniref:AraC-like DNA-binding protein n=2 Tax=Pedobacter duraquae TaxID=425511 RepID=A0A4R6INX6_9SPHI|nr:AraC-like DNA-binding protein [Pedobacter duraquae]